MTFAGDAIPYLKYLPLGLAIVWFSTIVVLYAKGLVEKQAFLAFPIGIGFILSRIFLRKFIPAQTNLGKFGTTNLPEISVFFTFTASTLISSICDIISMSILQLTTIWLILPLFLMAWLGISPVVLTDSIFGAAIGFLVPFLIGQAYKFFSGQEGLGSGDVQMFSCVGAFVGPTTCLWIVNLSSILCLLSITFVQMVSHKTIFRQRPIPFAPYITLITLAATLL